MLFTTVVSGAVLTFTSLHSYSEVAIFGISLITLASLTGYLLQGNRSGYQLILISSVIGILGIYSTNLLSMELLSTKLLIAQLSTNMLIVIGIYFFQSLSNRKTIEAK